MGRRNNIAGAMTALAIVLTLIMQVVVFAQTQTQNQTQTRAQATQTFENIKYLVQAGDRAEIHVVVLLFDADQLILRSAEDGNNLKIMSFTLIRNAEYSYARNLPWKPGLGFGQLFFVGRPMHWFAIQSENDFAVMQLDNRNFKAILTAFEARTGVKVQTVIQKE